jgi:hypothetical protein
MNAQTGEILAMASHPTFDSNKLDEDGLTLTNDPKAPLLNRAAQGQYPLSTALLPLVQAQFGDTKPTGAEMIAFYKKLGLFQTPAINMPIASGTNTEDLQKVRVSPLQVALAAATLSNHGIIPSPRIAMAVETPEQGWVVLPSLGQPIEAIQTEAADEAALSFIIEQTPFWSNTARGVDDEAVISWFIAGTLPDWQGLPLVVIVTLEEDNITLAENLGSSILTETLNQ